MFQRTELTNPAHPGESRGPALSAKIGASLDPGVRRDERLVMSASAGGKPIKIAVMGLGGQGGGVLAEWIVKAGERSGFIAQSTSVPGVAQRTGATIYYVELLPRAVAEARGKPPILALMPAPGDVDVLIASEMMEAGRALMRGFVSARTTLIASKHRVYAIGEKIAMGDGRQNTDQVKSAAEAAAGRCIWFDMERAAEDAGAVISAVMFGALAGSGATSLPKASFEETIRETGRAVERNLDGFQRGFDAANPAAQSSAPETRVGPLSGFENAAPAVASLAARLSALPRGVMEFAREGVKRAADFQDARYGALYLDRLEKVLELDRANGGDAKLLQLTRAVAKHLALFMAYDDVVRVADLKTRASRFARFREDVRADEGQIVRVWEYMHPRVEEFCDLMPAAMAKAILGSKGPRRAIGAVLGGGRRIATTNVSGFLMLRMLASMRFLRRGSYRFRIEEERTENWLALIAETALRDYALACEIAALQRLIKGYGETHERGLANYARIIDALPFVKAQPSPAAALARLRDAALKDEDGAALKAELAALSTRSAA
ncbi:MAG: indolepyruvate oxidoreductase subunit beta family protein [Pseudomonadota bacterium]